jgi:hypothetical protein
MLHKFRVLKSSWGIAIDIDMDVVSEADGLSFSEVSDDILVLVKDKDLNPDLHYLIFNAIKNNMNLIKSKKGSNRLYFIINKIVYNPTDFQDNALYYAVEDSIYNHFGEVSPQYEIEFDISNNSYIFK